MIIKNEHETVVVFNYFNSWEVWCLQEYEMGKLKLLELIF